jgi:hypothetical protein
VKSATGYTVTNTKDGKPVSKNHVSVVGSTLTRKIDYTPEGDAPYSMSFTSKRVSGGPGVAGVWKPTGFSESQDTGVLSIQRHGLTASPSRRPTAPRRSTARWTARRPRSRCWAERWP